MREQEKDANTPKQCDICGGFLNPEKIKIEEFEGGKLYVINDAPALTCQDCGEIWVPETIINELEQMMALTQKNKLLKLKKISKGIKKRSRSGKPKKRRSSQKDRR